MVRRHIYRHLRRFTVHHLLHTDDSPSRLARGIAIGIFVAWLPLIGLQMLIVLGLSFLLRANKLVGLPVVWISNIFTLVPIYYPSYLLGSAITGYNPVSMDDFERSFADIFYSSLPWTGRLGEMVNLLFEDFLYPTLIGSLVLGSILGLIFYFISLRAIRRHRARRHARRTRRLRSSQKSPKDTLNPQPAPTSDRFPQEHSNSG